MISVHDNDIETFLVWGERINLCKNFTLKIIQPHCVVLENKISVWTTLSNVFVELDNFLAYCGYHEDYEYSKSVALKILQSMSQIYNDRISINEFTDNLISRNKSFKIYESMRGREAYFHMVNISVFIYLVRHLNIDERDIFSKYGELEHFLRTSLKLCKQNNIVKQIINCQGENGTKTIFSNVINTLQFQIDALIEECDMKKVLWPPKLQNYSQIKKFISHNPSPFKGTFTNMRFF